MVLAYRQRLFARGLSMTWLDKRTNAQTDNRTNKQHNQAKPQNRKLPILIQLSFYVCWCNFLRKGPFRILFLAQNRKLPSLTQLSFYIGWCIFFRKDPFRMPFLTQNRKLQMLTQLSFYVCWGNFLRKLSFRMLFLAQNRKLLSCLFWYVDATFLERTRFVCCTPPLPSAQQPHNK